jgi:hypothetical protein
MQMNSVPGPSLWPNVDYFLVLHKSGETEYHRSFDEMKNILEADELKTYDMKYLVAGGQRLATDSSVLPSERAYILRTKKLNPASESVKKQKATKKNNAGADDDEDDEEGGNEEGAESADENDGEEEDNETSQDGEVARKPRAKKEGRGHVDRLMAAFGPGFTKGCSFRREQLSLSVLQIVLRIFGRAHSKMVMCVWCCVEYR